MHEIRKTDAYAQWLDGLRDIHVRARVLARVERLAADIKTALRLARNL